MSSVWLKILKNKTVAIEGCDLTPIYSSVFPGIVSGCVLVIEPSDL